MRQELDPLVLRTFEQTASAVGVPKDEAARMGSTYLSAAARLGVGP